MLTLCIYIVCERKRAKMCSGILSGIFKRQNFLQCAIICCILRSVDVTNDITTAWWNALRDNAHEVTNAQSFVHLTQNTYILWQLTSRQFTSDHRCAPLTCTNWCPCTHLECVHCFRCKLPPHFVASSVPVPVGYHQEDLWYTSHMSQNPNIIPRHCHLCTWCSPQNISVIQGITDLNWVYLWLECIWKGKSYCLINYKV